MGMLSDSDTAAARGGLATPETQVFASGGSRRGPVAAAGCALAAVTLLWLVALLVGGSGFLTLPPLARLGRAHRLVALVKRPERRAARPPAPSDPAGPVSAGEPSAVGAQ